MTSKATPLVLGALFYAGVACVESNADVIKDFDHFADEGEFSCTIHASSSPETSINWTLIYSRDTEGTAVGSNIISMIDGLRKLWHIAQSDEEHIVATFPMFFETLDTTDTVEVLTMRKKKRDIIASGTKLDFALRTFVSGKLPPPAMTGTCEFMPHK